MTLTEAIHELTRPWSEILAPDDDRTKYVIVSHEPRLAMLYAMIGSNTKTATSGGGALPSTRNLVDVTALDLWQKIDTQTRHALKQIGKTPRRNLGDALDQLGTDADALRNAAQMTEEDHTRLIGRARRWLEAIENLFDPPTRKEIRGACPNVACRAERVQTPGGETSALYAYYWRGQEPAAECQACGQRWHGERALLELGFSINANINHDELRAMGVAT